MVVNSASVYSVCSNCKHPPKRGAVTLPTTAASSARERIGTFTALLVPLWPRSRTE